MSTVCKEQTVLCVAWSSGNRGMTSIVPRLALFLTFVAAAAGDFDVRFFRDPACTVQTHAHVYPETCTADTYFVDNRYATSTCNVHVAQVRYFSTSDCSGNEVQIFSNLWLTAGQLGCTMVMPNKYISGFCVGYTPDVAKDRYVTFYVDVEGPILASYMAVESEFLGIWASRLVSNFHTTTSDVLRVGYRDMGAGVQVTVQIKVAEIFAEDLLQEAITLLDDGTISRDFQTILGEYVQVRLVNSPGTQTITPVVTVQQGSATLPVRYIRPSDNEKSLAGAINLMVFCALIMILCTAFVVRKVLK